MRFMLDGHGQAMSFSDEPLDLPDPSAILNRLRKEPPK
jgi:hypothetical protein